MLGTILFGVIAFLLICGCVAGVREYNDEPSDMGAFAIIVVFIAAVIAFVLAVNGG
jgi:hypothetical protein